MTNVGNITGKLQVSEIIATDINCVIKGWYKYSYLTNNVNNLAPPVYNKVLSLKHHQTIIIRLKQQWKINLIQSVQQQK